MSYFTATLAHEGDKWFAHEVEVEGVESLGDLADSLRLVENEEEPVLLLIEREDAWWAVVRVDGDDDPRVFMSDLLGVARSPFEGLLEGTADVDGEDVIPGACGGDFDLLTDLGTSPDDLRTLCDDQVIPMDALAVVAESAGFAEVLDSLR